MTVLYLIILHKRKHVRSQKSHEEQLKTNATADPKFLQNQHASTPYDAFASMLEIAQISVDVEDVEVSAQLVKARKNVATALDIN